MASATHGNKDLRHTAESFAQEAKDKAGAALDKAKEAGGTFVEKAKEAGGNFADKAKEVGGNFADKASSAVQGTRKIAENLGDRAEGAMHAVGSGMKAASETIRENLPQSGMLGSATNRVADTIESTGRYLEEQGFGDIGKDLTGMVRRNPVPALLCAAAIGFLLARATRS